MIKRLFGNLYFLTFLNGFLFASLLYFGIEGNYENQLFQAIHRNVDRRVNAADRKDSMVVKVMHACHDLMWNREIVFENEPLEGFKADLFHPQAVDLMTARGACGSFATVLARVFEEYDFPVRIAQMKSGGVFAAHNIVEVQTASGWVVLDPLYDLYFRRPDGKLASFADVSADWPRYSSQVPRGYDMSYRYEDVRYSNWGKIPVVLPAIKQILNITMGKEAADKVSLRTYFLRIYDVYFWIILMALVPVAIFSLSKVIKTQVFPRPNMPITFSNLRRYLPDHFPWKRVPVHARG